MKGQAGYTLRHSPAAEDKGEQHEAQLDGEDWGTHRQACYHGGGAV